MRMIRIAKTRRSTKKDEKTIYKPKNRSILAKSMDHKTHIVIYAEGTKAKEFKSLKEAKKFKKYVDNE